MMRYLVVDALLNGSGIRDKYDGVYLDPVALGLSPVLVARLDAWLLRYANELYYNSPDKQCIGQLDKEGKELAIAIKQELITVKLEYYSSAQMITELI